MTSSSEKEREEVSPEPKKFENLFSTGLKNLDESLEKFDEWRKNLKAKSEFKILEKEKLKN